MMLSNATEVPKAGALIFVGANDGQPRADDLGSLRVTEVTLRPTG